MFHNIKIENEMKDQEVWLWRSVWDLAVHEIKQGTTETDITSHRLKKAGQATATPRHSIIIL
jgi:hypothetical protein